MSDIKGIAHVSIPVSDVKRSRDFYVDVVGFYRLLVGLVVEGEVVEDVLRVVAVHPA